MDSPEPVHEEVICTQVSRQASQELPLPAGTSAQESQFLTQLSHGFLEDLRLKAEQKETQSPLPVDAQLRRG